MISLTQLYTLFFIFWVFFFFKGKTPQENLLKCSINQCHEKEYTDKCVQDKFTAYAAQRFIGKLLNHPCNKVLYFHGS